MVRISSQYDKEVGKVFVIRGDEAYARTTDSRVKVMASDSGDFNNYRVGLKCNVYRDKGDSKITLYDGDTVLNQFDWSDGTEEMWIGMNQAHTSIDTSTCVELAWGVPHEVYIKYHGNNQCLPSKSKALQIYEPLPDEYATNIAMTLSKVNNDVTVTVTIDINGVATQGTHDTDIEIYLDDEIVDPEHPTINTGDDNVASMTIEDIDVGIHTITAIVVGSDKIHTATAYEELVIGNKVEITQYPQPFIIGKENIILVSVKRFDDVPISGGSVTFNGETYVTGTDGIATIELTDIEDGVYHATYDGDDSDDITIETYNPVINIRADNSIVSYNKRDTLTISLTKPLEGIPVILTKKNRDNDATISEETLYTDSNGIITKTITGGQYNDNGTGQYVYEVQCYNTQNSVNVDDVIYAYKNTMQWNPNSIHISNGSVTENVSGLVVQGNDLNDFPRIEFVESGILTKSWILSFQVTPNTADLQMELGGNEYSLGIGNKSKASVEVRCSNRMGIATVSVYVDGVKTWVKNGNVVPQLILYPKDPNVIRKAVFHNMKLVRVKS